MTKRIFYHGTSKTNAEKILKEGFRTDQKSNWEVASKAGFIYFSLAYAPFYAMNATDGDELAIVKVEIDEKDLYPEDDFMMYVLDKPKYTQEDLAEVDLEKYKHAWVDSLKHMGNVAAKPESIKVLGIGTFDGGKLIYKCDPSITPMNFKIMGNYYKELTEWLFKGNDVMEFQGEIGM